jgi:hypothetical protein
MRLGVVTLLLGAGLAIAGCAAEKPPPVVGEDDITAAHLRNLEEDPESLWHLEPNEEDARRLAEQEEAAHAKPAGEEEARPVAEQERTASAKPVGEDSAERSVLEDEPTTEQKVAGASIAFLQVAVTVGAMIAPYFFF